ncbi:MAG TPA: glycosyltransferase family 4 protein [Patescibacteria group bacterium]|nr:glycosyltransferase family 4 protein [Patescibacteria group bacterium]
MTAKSKRRVLMLYDFPIKGGGSGAYVKYLSLRLQETRKYEVAIALPDKEPVDGLKTYPIKLPQIPVFIGRPGLEKSKRYAGLTSSEITDLYNAFLKETRKVVEDFKPDIIHAHHAFINTWVGEFIRSVYGIKIVITSHGSDLHAIAQDKRYWRNTREALRGAKAITVVSGDTRIKLIKMFGKDLSKKTRTIPGGVRMSLFPLKKPQKELAELRVNLNIQPGHPVVLFTGRLINEKGVEYLVKAASRINGQVVIAGEGPQKKHLQELIKTKKLTNVILTGYIDPQHLLNYYYLADVFVSPAVWDDPMPLTAMEAMAARLPVVVTRRGGMATAVRNGQNGYFVRSRNATDIAEKVNKLLSDSNLSHKMGERGREKVMQKFTWTKIAERFDHLYTKL